MKPLRLGLQKVTLLDYPGLVACTVFFPGCNFRCPYCHNGTLVLSGEPPLLPAEEVLDFLKKRSGLLDGVCFTGGEPLLHPELPFYAEYAKSFGYKIKLDTNGSFPDRLKAILHAGLADYVAMDLKNSPGKYAKTCGMENPLPSVEQSVDLLLKGNTEYEFRTTVTGNLHTVSDFTAIGQWICGASRYFLQPFRNSQDLLDKSMDYSHTEEFLSACLTAVQKYVPSAEIRGTVSGKENDHDSQTI